jgi:hypothetical protein
MTGQHLTAQIEHMAAAASERLADADLLEQSPQATSDSGYLLRLLAFEILLKALLAVKGVAPPKNHSYLELFDLLPRTVRERVLASAAERMSTSADYSPLAELLDTFAINFVALRYPYEAYESVSGDARKAAGKGWVAKGAPDSEATFVYYPEELRGLNYALTNEVRAWLAAPRTAG